MTNNEIHFNLLDEPWIRVLRSDGSIAECGVLEILQRAHELAEVYDPAPIVECGILRFLVAFVSDALGITTTNDIRQLLRSRQFDMGKINAYAGPLHDRFDLFDPDRPFFQVPLNMESKLSTPIATSDTKKAKAKKIKLKSVAVLFQYIPSGTNVVHFFHTLQDEHAASPASCARALCTLPPFAPSGGSGLSPSINRSPPIYALIQGKNLFDTIVLNCCGVPMPMNTGSKPVAWKLDAPVIAEKMRDASTLQGLTWQPRKVHLIPGEGGKCSLTGLESNVLVRQVLFDAAWSAKEIKSWSDPHVSYGKESVKSKKRYAIKLKR
nr:type I-E CRISPR-associated protein Cse1/CasA [Candidatus Sigynarchaeota archaeon]